MCMLSRMYNLRVDILYINRRILIIESRLMYLKSSFQKSFSRARKNVCINVIMHFKTWHDLYTQ